MTLQETKNFLDHCRGVFRSILEEAEQGRKQVGWSNVFARSHLIHIEEKCKAVIEYIDNSPDEGEESLASEEERM